MKVTLHPKQIIRSLLLVALLLTLINSIVLYFYFHSEAHIVDVITHIFDFDYEGTIPALFSAVLLLLCSLVLALHARGSRLNRDGALFYWASLSTIFCFLALDEAAGIHENTSDLFETFMEAEGALYFLWVIPYGVATLVIGLFYFRFVLKLPPPIRRRFIVAGTIFLMGALGFEMLGARQADAHGVENVTYCALYTIEEFLEMLGAILFLSALLTHLGPFTLNLGSAAAAGES